MIARHDVHVDKTDIWSKLAAPLPSGVISWRQDGRPVTRDGKHFARFVAYVDANTVRERLDSVVPGEWDLTLELLPAIPGDEEGANCSFKARLQILGVIREDVGTGKDYKSAATDAFKRVAVRFGIAHELYDYDQNWVRVDGDGRFAKPLEDPAVAYARRQGQSHGPAVQVVEAERPVPTAGGGGADKPVLLGTDVPSCPSCGGRMWDNRASKRNPKAPDFKCRDRSCDGVIWPPKGAAASAPAAPRQAERQASAEPLVPEMDEPDLQATGTDDIPF